MWERKGESFSEAGQRASATEHVRKMVGVLKNMHS